MVPVTEHVVLVDRNGRRLGVEEKLRAHALGALHRAVSVFAFNEKGELLLQQRANGKYHSAGLWSNSACTHPRDGEDPPQAAARCLRDELGIEGILRPAFEFLYRARVPSALSGLIEHEYDHVFVGTVQGEPQAAPNEVSAWRFAALDDVRREMASQPERFTAWFQKALPLLDRWHAASGDAPIDDRKSAGPS